eukprot:scaffold1244_cov162-Ochromonas_danica.AAC.6
MHGGGRHRGGHSRCGQVHTAGYRGTSRSTATATAATALTQAAATAGFAEVGVIVIIAIFRQRVRTSGSVSRCALDLDLHYMSAFHAGAWQYLTSSIAVARVLLIGKARTLRHSSGLRSIDSRPKTRHLIKPTH